MNDQRDGSKFIQAFLNHIKDDFLKQNITYTKPLLFDLWWIDTQVEHYDDRKRQHTVVHHEVNARVRYNTIVNGPWITHLVGTVLRP